MVAVRDFSGLMSSAWALAKAEASAATDSLDRGMGGLRVEHIEAHRARFRALGAHAMADGFLGILRHQGFELVFWPVHGRETHRACHGTTPRTPPMNSTSSCRRCARPRCAAAAARR